MCAFEVSFVRNEASIELSLCICPCAIPSKEPTVNFKVRRYPCGGRQCPPPPTPPDPRRSCSRRRAATARASIEPCRRSSTRSTSTASRSTSARRSCTTSTSSTSWRSAGRSSSRRRPRCPRARWSSSRPTASPPSVHANAAKRQLRTIDATCPLVTKVHVEARKFAADGYTVVLIGHEGHEEVEGTTGEAPDDIVLVQTESDVDDLEVDDPDRIAYITQTTLSVDETSSIIAKLKATFPNAVGPKTDDICYATTNRQIAVKQLARECDLVLVIGSTNSSNSNRLVEVAREHGAASHLIDFHTQVREEWLDGVETVGITSGASAPEELVEQLVEFFRERGASDVST